MSTRHFRFSEVSSAPNTPGVYSWYYRIELTDKDIAKCIEDVELENSQEVRDDLVRSFLETHPFRYCKEMPYFIALSGQLKPKYEGFIDHCPEVSSSLIRRLSTAPHNLYELKRTLKLAIPLFAPCRASARKAASATSMPARPSSPAWSDAIAKRSHGVMSAKLTVALQHLSHGAGSAAASCRSQRQVRLAAA